MSTGPTNLYDLAQSLLSAVAAQFALDVVAPPARQYVTVDPPTADCDALVIAYSRLYMGVAGSAENMQSANRAQTRLADLAVYVMRCGVPTATGTGTAALQAPSVAKYDAYGQTVLTDAYVLHRGVWRARMGGTFGDYLTGLVIGPAVPMPPEGGISGVRMLVTVACE